MSWTAHHRDRSTWPAQVYGRHARGSPKVSFAEKLALYFSPTFYPWNLHLKRYCIAVNWVAGLGLPGILLDFFTTWPERDVSVARNQQNCSLEPKKQAGYIWKLQSTRRKCETQFVVPEIRNEHLWHCRSGSNLSLSPRWPEIIVSKFKRRTHCLSKVTVKTWKCPLIIEILWICSTSLVQKKKKQYSMDSICL
jgi:hypothetical protein